MAILQHPSEVGHPKGTAWLAHQSILGSQLFIGEKLAELTRLQAWLRQGNVYLLYPCATAETCNVIQASALANPCASQVCKIKVLVLDGTWRKTYRLLQANPVLAALPRVSLSHHDESGYVIRKSKRQDSLSTIEAIYSLFAEADPASNYQSLLRSLEGLVALHQQFRPN